MYVLDLPSLLEKNLGCVKKVEGGKVVNTVYIYKSVVVNHKELIVCHVIPVCVCHSSTQDREQLQRNGKETMNWKYC